jgi:glycosyltransferase involved in cell wall biosynthesis
MDNAMLSSGKKNTANFYLAIVIPCFNEEKRIDLHIFREQIRLSEHYLFCFVDDGSTDQTASLLFSLRDQYSENVLVLQNSSNKGKAEAVRNGINFLAQFNIKYICYWDADLSTPLQEVTRLYKIISGDERLLLVFGSRVSLFGHHIKRPFHRYFLGRLFAGMIRYILNLQIYDTQCGIKIFHYNLVNLVFEKPFVTKWLFDVEVFVRIKLSYGPSNLSTIMKEVPLYEWKEVKGTKLNILDFIKTPFFLFVFAINMKYGKMARARKIHKRVTGPVNI